jgi:hypothetical protein
MFRFMFGFIAGTFTLLVVGIAALLSDEGSYGR